MRFLSRYPALGILLALLAPGFAQTPQPDNRAKPDPHRFALLIGVEKYREDSGFEPLIGPDNDVDQMREALIKSAGFDPNNITVLTDSKSREKPNRLTILSELSKMRAQIHDNDLVLIMFSGHGMERDGEVMLLAQDSVNRGDPDLLRESSVQLSYIGNFVRNSRAGQVVVILDACRSDPSEIASKGEEPEIPKSAYEKAFDLEVANRGIKAYVVLYATSKGQLAWIDPQRKMGYFSAALVDGLNGEAKTADGNVTIASLLQYAKKEVSKTAQNAPETQIPDFFSNGDANELVLAHFPTITQPTQSALKAAESDVVKELCRPTVQATRDQQKGVTKPEVCPEFRPDLVDTSYHQSDFDCCSGIAKPTMTLSDIPSGFELSVDPHNTGSYSVSDVKLLGKKFSLTLFCAPTQGFWRSGCKNMVIVKVHYLAQPKAIPQVSSPAAANSVAFPPVAPPPTPPNIVLARQLQQLGTQVRDIWRYTDYQRREIAHRYDGYPGYPPPHQVWNDSVRDEIAKLNDSERSQYLAYQVQIKKYREQGMDLLKLPGLKLLEDTKNFEAADTQAAAPFPLPHDIRALYANGGRYTAMASYLEELANRLIQIPSAPLTPNGPESPATNIPSTTGFPKTIQP